MGRFPEGIHAVRFRPAPVNCLLEESLYLLLLYMQLPLVRKRQVQAAPAPAKDRTGRFPLIRRLLQHAKEQALSLTVPLLRKLCLDYLSRQGVLHHKALPVLCFHDALIGKPDPGYPSGKNLAFFHIVFPDRAGGFHPPPARCRCAACISHAFRVRCSRSPPSIE